MDKYLFGELIVQSDFEKTIQEIRERRINVPDIHAEVQSNFANFGFPPSGEKIDLIDGKIKVISLNPEEGQRYYTTHRIAAYDESIDKYSCLEGDLYVTAHSIIQLTGKEYLPIGLVTANFYTRAKKLAENSAHIKYTECAEIQYEIDYALDKIAFLEDKVVRGSTVFIDGPLIGGDVYTYMIKLLEKYNEQGTVPVFFVKNSYSNLVVGGIDNLRERYNSDLHWASTILKKGQRTSFFRYTDKQNERNSKVFCYCRLFDGSPQRVEFFGKSFHNNRKAINGIMNCIYYMAILQGLDRNPQIRPIVIAEKYAREYIKLCDIKETFRKLSLTTPAINSERFGR